MSLKSIEMLKNRLEMDIDFHHAPFVASPGHPLSPPFDLIFSSSLISLLLFILQPPPLIPFPLLPPPPPTFIGGLQRLKAASVFFSSCFFPLFFPYTHTQL